MPLKDLVANKAALTESAIEEIVRPYLRYDIDARELVLTPEGASLKNEARILVYLVGNLGWRFVRDDEGIVATKPADLEAALSIPGGTLRPVLKNLKDRNLVHSNDQGYEVRVSNLDAVARVIAGEKSSTPVSRKSAPAAGKKVKVKSTAGSGAGGAVSTLIAEEFFEDWRPLAAVQKRLAEKGELVEQTALSTPLIRAVRKKLLVRRARQDGKRTAWEYKSAAAK